MSLWSPSSAVGQTPQSSGWGQKAWLWGLCLMEGQEGGRSAGYIKHKDVSGLSEENPIQISSASTDVFGLLKGLTAERSGNTQRNPSRQGIFCCCYVVTGYKGRQGRAQSVKSIWAPCAWLRPALISHTYWGRKDPQAPLEPKQLG